MRELYLLDNERRYLFTDIDHYTSPSFEFGRTIEVTAESKDELATVTLFGQLGEGDSTLLLSFLNDYHSAPNDRNIYVETVRVKDAEGTTVATYELESDTLTFRHNTNCNRNEDGHVRFFCAGVVEMNVNVGSAGTYMIEIDTWADLAGDQNPRLHASVHSSTSNSVGERAIKAKLVELSQKLLGSELSIDGAEIQDRYDLLVSAWERNQTRGWEFQQGLSCNHGTDYKFLEGVIDDPVVAVDQDVNGIVYTRNNEAWGALRRDTNWGDPTGVAGAWVVVLSSFLMDYDYLHL